MNIIPKFKIYDNEETTDGVFEWGKARNEIFDLYYEASELFYAGEIERAQNALHTIIGRDSHFVDAYNLLATIEIGNGEIEKGIHLQERALKIGEQIIPDSFDGNIRWGFTENRPYLRAMHAVAMNHALDNQFKQSIGLLERLLAYNPGDNQGIRYLIGDFYFLENQLEKAEQIYKQNQDFPPYLYSYGLLQMAMGHPEEAITLFRKSILENIYISDYLRVKVPIIPYEIWHGSNYETPEMAYAYLDFMLPKWVEYPPAIDLLQFLHTYGKSRIEIEQVYMLKHELYFADSEFEDEESSDMRIDILEEIKIIKRAITSSSSKKLLRQWKQTSIDF